MRFPGTSPDGSLVELRPSWRATPFYVGPPTQAHPECQVAARLAPHPLFAGPGGAALIRQDKPRPGRVAP